MHKLRQTRPSASAPPLISKVAVVPLLFLHPPLPLPLLTATHISSSMSSVSVPEELCLEMAETTIAVGSKTDLINLSSINRDWRRICTPLIWKNTSIIWHRDTLHLFGENLVFLPSVAEHVKVLRIVNVPHSEQSLDALHRQILRSSLASFVLALSSLSHITQLTIVAIGNYRSDYFVHGLLSQVVPHMHFHALSKCHFNSPRHFAADSIAKGISAFLKRHPTIIDLSVDIPDFLIPTMRISGHLAYYYSMIREVPALKELRTHISVALNGPLPETLRVLHMTGTTVSMKDTMHASQVVLPNLEALYLPSGVLSFDKQTSELISRRFPNLQEIYWMEAVYMRVSVKLLFREQAN